MEESTHYIRFGVPMMNRDQQDNVMDAFDEAKRLAELVSEYCEPSKAGFYTIPNDDNPIDNCAYVEVECLVSSQKLSELVIETLGNQLESKYYISRVAVEPHAAYILDCITEEED